LTVPEPRRPPQLRLAVSASLLVGLGHNRRNLDRPQLIIDRDKREIRGEDVPPLLGLEILGEDLHDDLQAGAPGAVDGGFEDEDVAVAGGGEEADGVDAEREADAAVWRLQTTAARAVGLLDTRPPKSVPIVLRLLGKTIEVWSWMADSQTRLVELWECGVG
jgi:hypothetical protein